LSGFISQFLWTLLHISLEWRYILKNSDSQPNLLFYWKNHCRFL
jgi:hypothetical protein